MDGVSQQESLNAIAKNTQMLRELGKQVSLAERSKLTHHQPIFLEKNEEAEPLGDLFPTPDL